MNRYLRKIAYGLLLGVLFMPCLPLMGKNEHVKDFEMWANLTSKELNELGEKYYQSDDYEKALQVFMIICSRYNPSDNEENQRIYTKGFIRSGNAQYQMIAYSSAMDFYLKALRIAETHKFDDLTGVIYAHIGNIYATNNDFESAVKAYKRAIPYAYEFDNENLKSMVLNNLGGAYYFMGEIDSAEHYFRLFQNLDFNDPRFIYDIFLNRALFFSGMNHNDSAKFYAKKAIQEAKANDLPATCIGACHSCIAQFFEEENQLDSALFYLHLNETMARETQSNDLLIASVRDLGRIYDKLNEREKALTYKSEYLTISDSILSQKEFNDLKNKQVFYELERNASTINSLNAIRMLQRNGLVVLSVAMLIFIILIVILYRQKRRLKAAWSDLYERNHRQLLDETRYKQRIQALEKSLEKADIKISALATLATANQQALSEEAGAAKVAGTADVAGAADAKAADGAGTEAADSDMAGAETASAADETDSAGTEEPTGGRKVVVNTAQRDRIARDILRVMETTEDYCACDYSIDKLAAAIDSNARYVSEVINDVFGKNFRAMLNEYRIKMAMIRLSDIEHYGNLTIKAISESVGYKSQATFITAFTKFTGLKPGLYQKLAVERHAKGERMDTALTETEAEI